MIASLIGTLMVQVQSNVLQAIGLFPIKNVKTRLIWSYFRSHLTIYPIIIGVQAYTAA